MICLSKNQQLALEQLDRREVSIPMTVQTIFQEASKTGHLTDEMKADIEQLCAPETELSEEEHLYLDLLMGAIFSGEIH